MREGIRKRKMRKSGNPIASICNGKVEDGGGDKEEEDAKVGQYHRQHLQWKRRG